MTIGKYAMSAIVASIHITIKTTSLTAYATPYSGLRKNTNAAATKLVVTDTVLITRFVVSSARNTK